MPIKHPEVEPFPINRKSIWNWWYKLTLTVRDKSKSPVKRILSFLTVVVTFGLAINLGWHLVCYAVILFGFVLNFIFNTSMFETICLILIALIWIYGYADGFETSQKESKKNSEEDDISS